mmetsp:Transcript_9219/g.37796  ORF Transcript_9219/g.37796 Transcript_9219/m.37796 type:complete len:101 (+) Transcript_9219:312-614(+)
MQTDTEPQSQTTTTGHNNANEDTSDIAHIETETQNTTKNANTEQKGISINPLSQFVENILKQDKLIKELIKGGKQCDPAYAGSHKYNGFCKEVKTPWRRC